MARYKDYNYEQDKLLSIRYSRQILPGSFEHTLSKLIDDDIDLSVFDARYRNDETGAPACAPALLLKAIVQGSIAHFGKYSVDEKGRKINLHYDGSTYPNWDGEEQIRLVQISGDDLTIISPVSAVGGGTVHLLLRRAE